MKIDRPGIYLHIPFCLRKCPYCDFTSYPLAEVEYEEQAGRYITALLQEISLRQEWLESMETRPTTFHSLYIGGGTPSLLASAHLAKLLGAIRQSLPLTKTAEITLEVNPGTTTQEQFITWQELGINRLSLGVQSLDDNFLAKLGRVHTSVDAYRAIRESQLAGFSNLSFDLMLGLPGQSLRHWQTTLSKAIGLGPKHISCYELTIESGTAYGSLYDAGQLDIPPEDEVISMLEWTSKYLTGMGYTHYEISNYALPGFKSRHNQIYWQNRWYLGLGVAAYSYWEGRRWGNTMNLKEYSESLASGKLPEATAEVLDAKGQLAETVMLGLRLREGVSLSELKARFGLSVWDEWQEEINSLLSQGLLRLSQGRLSLTWRGLLLANRVQSAFLGSS